MRALLSALIVTLSPVAAQANVVATFTERSTDVLLEISGSLDRTLLGTNSIIGGNFPSSVLVGSSGFRAGPPSGTVLSDTYIVNDYYQSFKSGSFVIGSYLSGPNIAFDNNGPQDQVRIENGYVSGTPFSTSGTLPGDFDSLGFTTTESIVMSFTGSGTGAGTQSLTVNFVEAAPVPLPAGLGLLAAGLGVLALRRRSAGG